MRRWRFILCYLQSDKLGIHAVWTYLAFIWCCDLVTKSNAVFCCHQQQNRLVSFLWQDKIGGEMRSMNHEEVWASDVLIINTHWLYPLVKHSYQTITEYGRSRSRLSIYHCLSFVTFQHIKLKSHYASVFS